MKKSEKPVKDDFMVQRLTEILHERTCTWGKKYGFYQKDSKPAETEKYSETAKKLARILDNHSFSGHDSAIRDLMEAIINEKLPLSKNDKTVAITYDLGVVVVAISNPNNHGYPLGEPILITKADGQGFVAKDSPADCTKALPNNSLTAIRLATRNEIQELLESTFENKDRCFNAIIASFFLENIK